MDFSVAVLNEDTMEKGPNIDIKEASLGTVIIDVSINDRFCLTLESNNNVSNNFDASVAGGMNKTRGIMRVGISVSNKSLAIHHEMVQERWVIHPSVSKNTAEHTTWRGVRIFSHIHNS